MKIQRDGVEIELTSREVYTAWEERQRDYYTQDMEEEINSIVDGMTDEDILEEYGCSLDEIRALIPRMVNVYWKGCDKDDCISEDMAYHRRYAFKHILDEYMKGV